MAVDPAEATYAFTVLEADGAKPPSIVWSGFVWHTVRNLTNMIKLNPKASSLRARILPEMRTGHGLFAREVGRILHDHEVTDLIFERFQIRRVFTASVELVSFMNGALVSEARHAKPRPRVRGILAADWKRAIERAEEGGLERLYAIAEKHDITHHTVDTLGIGVFYWNSVTAKGSYPVPILETLVRKACKTGPKGIIS